MRLNPVLVIVLFSINRNGFSLNFNGVCHDMNYEKDVVYLLIGLRNRSIDETMGSLLFMSVVVPVSRHSSPNYVEEWQYIIRTRINGRSSPV